MSRRHRGPPGALLDHRRARRPGQRRSPPYEDAWLALSRQTAAQAELWPNYLDTRSADAYHRGHARVSSTRPQPPAGSTPASSPSPRAQPDRLLNHSGRLRLPLGPGEHLHHSAVTHAACPSSSDQQPRPGAANKHPKRHQPASATHTLTPHAPEHAGPPPHTNPAPTNLTQAPFTNPSVDPGLVT